MNVMCWIVKEKAVIGELGKCSWGACIFCGWGKRIGKDTPESFMKKVEKVLKFVPKRVKVFTSGSFFDDVQYPPWLRLWLAERLERSCVEELQVESLPDFITYEKLQPFLRRSYSLIVALGLEVADDEALKLLGKYPAMSVEKYVSIALTLKNLGVKVKTYVLVNPPIPNWRKLLNKTVNLALKYSDEVVLINTYPHSDSPLFKMWVEGKWKPLPPEEFYEVVRPWLDDPRVQVDSNNFGFRPKFPKHMRKKIVGANKEALLHPYYEVWQEFFERFYSPPKNKKILLFVPCSYKKPYYKSKTWRAIRRVLRELGVLRKVHMVAVSSPGVVPEEFADEYPFNSYDWPEWEETEEIKELYTRVTAERVKRYLEKHWRDYEAILVYLKPDSESFKAVMKACEELGVNCKPCIRRYTEEVKSYKPPVAHPLALEDLRSCLEETLKSLSRGPQKSQAST